MANRRINIADLDFDSIKANLKEYLRGQEQFTDYDFEGSNMSIILDILAYNTHYNGMYNNMVINETFLDSASRRDTVVALARSLGYVPRSATAATVKANLVFVDDSVGAQTILTFPRYSPFKAQKDGQTYTLYTNESHTVGRTLIGNQYYFIFNNVTLVEGTPISNTFEYTDKNLFLIPNDRADLSTLEVRIQPSPNSTLYTNYQPAAGYSSLESNSEVYFIKEINGRYYIYFGDDVFGKRPSIGSIVNASYFACSGELPNGITSINYTGPAVSGGSLSSITMQGPINGGRYAESIEEIRFNAPNFYASQNRAVTSTDYESLILKNVPSIDAVSVWGGENNVPPQYGKVFISAKTVSGRDLTTAEQQQIIDQYIEPSKVVTVIPEFVPPSFINVALDVVVYYDSTLASSSLLGVNRGDIEGSLTTLIRSALIEYDENELQKFNKVLRKSVISRIVESVDKSIVSSVPRLRIFNPIVPNFGIQSSYIVNIGNPITPKGMISSEFYILGDTQNTYILTDDGSGKVYLNQILKGSRLPTTYGLAGTIDYKKGIVYINNLTITRASYNQLVFTIEPSAADIAGGLNTIVRLDQSILKVSLISDASTKGRSYAGNKFIFTPNSI